MTWIGSALVNSLFAMRDPVTMISSPPVCAAAGDAASAITEAVAVRNTEELVLIFIFIFRLPKLIPPPGGAETTLMGVSIWFTPR